MSLTTRQTISKQIFNFNKIVINTFYRKWIILGILFLLPVVFLLFLYPSTHNYNTLDIVNENIKEQMNIFCFKTFDNGRIELVM